MTSVEQQADQKPVPQSAAEQATQEAFGTEAAAPGGKKRTFVWFGPQDERDLTESGLMEHAYVNPQVFSEVDFTNLHPGASARVLFADDKPGGLSLVHVWFGENFPLPRHTHNVDCLYFILKGELRMGAKTIPAGSGLFIPADRPYTYRAGPGGVELLEFRGTNNFDMKILDQTVEKWQAFAAIADTMHESWRATNPALNGGYSTGG